MISEEPSDIENDDTGSAAEDGSLAALRELREEMTASTAEWRRGSRRQMEALKEFGAALGAMGEMVRDLHGQARQEPVGAATAAASSGGLADEWLHVLIDLHDRVARGADAMSATPAGADSFWPAARARLGAWKQAWSAQSEAAGMLRAHLQGLLRRAGLRRVSAVGQPFDPALMTAVEVTHDARLPDHQVTAELLPGWIEAATGRLVRPAQVRVSRRQPAGS